MPRGQVAPVPCPKCGGDMWDNSDRAKGKQPIYKCKDKENCEGAVWRDKETAAKPAAAKAAGSGRPQNSDRYPVFSIYAACVKHAGAEFVAVCAEQKVEPTAEALAAQIATLFIQSCQSRGPLTRQAAAARAEKAAEAKAKAEAERKKREEEEARARAMAGAEEEEYAGVFEDEDSDLPF